MRAHRLLPAPTASRQRPGLPLRPYLSVFATWAAKWLTAAADYHRAAGIYERLSRLSDAELQRRGLSRATLARDICAVCDRTSSERD